MKLSSSLPVLLVLVVALAFTACDNMRDTNGTLGGMWQLTQLYDKTTHENADKRSEAVYYSFHRQLMRLQQLQSPTAPYYNAYFTHTTDSLILHNIYKVHRTGDTLVSTRDVAFLHVPADGRFRILQLKDDRLVLDDEACTLTFRKY